ncbi:MAG: hypothetical protein JWR19_1066 [Pedosphaera sp.]|nr:hypothetical protein [Pedosphaera sp.]
MCVLLGFSALRGANGAMNDADGQTYGCIAARNIFDLHGPAAQPAPEPVTAPSLQIKLTGITTILGDKRALFLIQQPAFGGKPAGKEESCILSEGQRAGGIEVLAIDEKAARVKLNREGRISWISFETPKLPNTSAPPPPLPGGV